MPLRFPKPKRQEKKAPHKERPVVDAVRGAVYARDGYCRLAGVRALGPCAGPSEWAHFEGAKRWQTRGMEAALRHRADASLMLCRSHHARYDGRAANRLRIAARTARGTAGPLRFEAAGVVYMEEEQAA